MPILTTGAGAYPVIGGGGATTVYVFGTNMGSDFTSVTNSGHTVNGAAVAAGSWESAFPTTGHSSGKYYFEVVLAATDGGLQMIGVCNVSTPVNNWVGSTSSSGCSMWSNGSIVATTSGGTTGVTFANGDVVGVAVDITSQLIWWRVNGGAWTNSGNPAAGTGANGYAISGAMYPCVSLHNTVGSLTTNFGQSSFAASAPSGFSAWG